MSLDIHPILLYVATAAVVLRLLLQESDDVLKAVAKLLRHWRKTRALVGGRHVAHIVVAFGASSEHRPPPDQPAHLFQLHPPLEAHAAPVRTPSVLSPHPSDAAAVRAHRRRS